MATKRHNPHACDAWQLLVKFSFTQNTQVLAAGRGTGALAGAVPRAPPPRTQQADPDAPAGRWLVLRRVERHRPGRSARIEGPGTTDGVGRGSARQGDRADAEGRAPARRVHGAHGRPAGGARAPQRSRAADTGPDPGPPARMGSPGTIGRCVRLRLPPDRRFLRSVSRPACTPTMATCSRRSSRCAAVDPDGWERCKAHAPAGAEAADPRDRGEGERAAARRPVRVLHADDHAVVREGLRESLTTAAAEVVGEAADGVEASPRRMRCSRTSW